MIPALAIGGAAWLIVAAVGGAGWSAVSASMKRRARSWVQDVPTLDEDDAAWLDAWPSVEEAEQAAIDQEFAAIVADLRSAS